LAANHVILVVLSLNSGTYVRYILKKPFLSQIAELVSVKFLEHRNNAGLAPVKNVFIALIGRGIWDVNFTFIFNSKIDPNSISYATLIKKVLKKPFL
jgi:hypothetical protein